MRRVDSMMDMLHCAPAAPLLGPDEEAIAIAIAVADRRVSAGLPFGDCPQSVVRASASRTAAIAFGMPHQAPSMVAVVDLARRAVTQIIPG